MLISALFWIGPPHKLLRLIEKGELSLCITPLLIEELQGVLNRPLFSSLIVKYRTSCDEIIAAILEMAEIYPDKKIENIVKDDPDDDKVVACALTSGAKYIITGDLHLLNLKKWLDISILTQQQFLKKIK